MRRKAKVWNLDKFGTSPWYGTTINLFLSKLCRKNPTRNVVDWYEIGVMVYFEFCAQSWPFLFCSTPLRLGGSFFA